MAGRADAAYDTELLSFGFNQDASCIAAGTNSGYRIFNCEPFGRNAYVTEGGIGIVQMLFSTSLVALVGGGDNPAFSPRCLKLWNSQSATTICKLDFDTRILTVHMNRTRLVVVLADKLHIYDLESMKNLHVLDCVDVAGVKSAVAGVFALSPSSERCFLGMPTGVVCGDVLIYDAKNLSVVNVVQAHKNPVRCMAFSADGSLLATASVNGTIIRVFQVPSGNKIGVFRRGSYSAVIHSLAFDPTNTWLAVTSSSMTAHVFKINHSARGVGAGTGGTRGRGAGGSSIGGSNNIGGSNIGNSSSNRRVGGVGGVDVSAAIVSVVSGVSEMLPGPLHDLVEPERSFASAKVPYAQTGSSPSMSSAQGKSKGSNSAPPVAVRSVCAITGDVIQVVTSEAMYFEFGITPNVLEKVRAISLSDRASTTMTATTTPNEGSLI